METLNSLQNLQNLKMNIKNNVLTLPEFKQLSDKNLKLSDTVIVYTDGKVWKIIPYHIIKYYPIILDKYYEPDSNEGLVFDITIYVCPFTLFSIVYFGQYIPNNKVYNNNLTIVDKNNEDSLIIPITNTCYSIQLGIPQDCFIRRNEARIMTLRNAISKYPDCVFINPKLQLENPIIDNDYYLSSTIMFNTLPFLNKYNPKTLVWIIEYFSKKSGINKKTVLIPKKMSNTQFNNFDIVKNGFDYYLNKMSEKIKMKNGVVYCCYWFAWAGIYPHSKIIEL